ncbi:MAG: 3-hydroxybutyryl-CoA dehydratase [Alphaproteobacteria bacterium]|nr:3-hydroxybutyryl-CoA dehydratase [Alphaproteobacteria bacterium]HCP00230.1 enoyl-CoA hydratase/isomerase family protein [Rhodospirillaceae bacterium]
MSAEHLLTETRDRVLHITIDRVEKHNALATAIIDAIGETFRQAAGDDSLVAAVLRGAGEKTFAAGGDLHELAGLRTKTAAENMALNAKAAFNAIRDFPVPVIAGLNGNAFGGGAELAVSCDFRVAAAHARIGFVQGRLALATAWGGGPDLLDLVGRARGLRLMSTGEMIEPMTALEIGLYDAVGREDEDIDETIDSFLEPIRRQKPQSMRAFKAVSDAHRRRDSRIQMHDIETRMFVETWVHEDHWEAAEKVLPANKG